MRHKLKTTMLILFLVGIAFSADAAKVEDFMPKESILYVQLQDIDAVYGEIETSENWQKALALLPGGAAEVQQAIEVAEAFLSTDLLSVLETVGYRTALAIWLDETRAPQGGLVIHSGGNLSELQRFTKIVEGAIGLSRPYTLRLEAGVYQRVRYNVMEMSQDETNPDIIKYGFVDDFLLLGVGEWSFEKLMDTYRKDAPSIQQNAEFARMLKKMGAGEVIVFADAEQALSLVDGFGEWGRTQLPIFQSTFMRINFLETGPFHQVAVRFNPDSPDFPENEIGLFFEKGKGLEILNALSGEEDLFVAVVPNVVESVWKIVRSQIQQNATDEVTNGISYLEGLFNLNLEEDVMTGLTGEVALSVSDLTRFDLASLEGIQVNVDGAFTIDAAGVETDGGLIFKPANFMKWNQFTNSLSNLQNISVSQTVYNETTVSGFATNIYYSEAEGMFLLSLSEEQMYALVDGIKQKKKPSYLKQIPETIIAFAQLNLARALEIGVGAPPPDKILVSSAEIAPTLTWISVDDDEVMFEMVLSTEDTPIEAIAKLVPFYIWNSEN